MFGVFGVAIVRFYRVKIQEAIRFDRKLIDWKVKAKSCSQIETHPPFAGNLFDSYAAHSMTLRHQEDIQLFVAQYYRLSVVGIYLSTILFLFVCGSFVSAVSRIRLILIAILLNCSFLPLIYSNSVSMKPTHLHSISHFNDKIGILLRHLESNKCVCLFIFFSSSFFFQEQIMICVASEVAHGIVFRK